MAQFDCIIDTQPMAAEINSVSNHIKGTTAAVAGMKAAVIQAEAEAANQVCENVNKGFYSLIHSQISQKTAKLRSEVDSHVMKLNQLRRQLLSIKDRMERDYGMISQRYLKLFNGLNKNLQQRVFELDKPVIEFAVKDVNTISNRTKHLTATVPVSQSESLAISQKIIASNIKYRGMKVIDSMSKFLSDVDRQDEITRQVLLPQQTAGSSEPILIPVLISESNYDKTGNKRTDIIAPQTGLTQRSQENIRNMANALAAEFVWQEESVNEEVKSEFNKFLAASSASQRVKDMASRLFAQHNFQTIKHQGV